ncbi:lipoprotein-releasing system ATP-binding protein [Malonomonas rubra DSM 5091]|uniref:Lipoprotein-releasing system ATP-binding protein n=1 Tax=Malonomonas rubra DSM 5091 TaxID=1122189 RepID=A0A1M6C9L8_MALRU|nr:ABC transporter ATP-binding protein [Malonomonas rubra]SHI57563.1 lipoprotein-releasing system ATP-binding protein [Malonomonas rubra DSM 5091]
MSSPALIEICNLQKRFSTPGGEIHVLRQVDAQISAGERVAVVGTSGAGKTTLMHILGGLDRPSDGEVRFSGEDIFALRGVALDEFRNRTVGFVFQFHQLLPEFTALENVMMPLLIGGVGRTEAAEKATELLGEVGLEQRLNHKPGALSGGEQQRVAIARALVRQPQILLADEPTGNLDSGTSDEILQLLNRMHRTRGLTMLIVTHNRELAASLDRILRMEDGRLVDDQLN